MLSRITRGHDGLAEWPDGYDPALRRYAAEELVAELASAFLAAEFGINKEVRHAAYIAHWIELLKHDDRAFFTAASKAQKAAESPACALR